MNKTVKLSKGFIRLPLAIAHGMLSDLPVEYGIYSDLFGCIFFTLVSGGSFEIVPTCRVHGDLFLHLPEACSAVWSLLLHLFQAQKEI